MRDKGYKVDKYDIVLVNFNRLVHRGDRETDDPYMLTSQVDQVFYVKDGRNPVTTFFIFLFYFFIKHT